MPEQRSQVALGSEVVDRGCPVCGAPPGDFCHTPSGKPRNDHKGREYAPVPERSQVAPMSGPTICSCGCGCEPDGDWHFNEPRCCCRSLGCPCVVDGERDGRDRSDYEAFGG